MKHSCLLTFISFTLISSFAQTSIPNASFESWDSTWVDQNSFIMDDSLHQVENVMAGMPEAWHSDSYIGVHQTTDSYAGDYALEINHWYHYAWENVWMKKAMNDRPSRLTGYYKSIPASLMDANDEDVWVEITLTRDDAGAIDTIGTAELPLSPTAEYQAFAAEIAYQSTDLPDSVELRFHTGSGFCEHPTGKYFYIDELLWEMDANALPSLAESDWVNMHWTQDIVDLQLKEYGMYDCELLDMNGKVLIRKTLAQGQHQLSISALPAGIYTVMLKGVKGQMANKILKH